MPTESSGLLLGFIGVACFSVSLPATRVAVRELGVLFVSCGRAVVAGVLAIIVLRLARVARPAWADLPQFLGVVVGVVFGFPLLSGFALQHAPAGHGSIVNGLLPAATAGLGVLRAGERPSRRFWAFAMLGVSAIVGMAVIRGTKDIAIGDLYLTSAVLIGSIGYVEGALLSKRYGGWQTICWALVIALPINLIVMIAGLGPVGGDESWTAWFSFSYLGVVSMFLGFFAWYGGLARGGIARVSQIQLFQPLMALTWATIFLREHFDWLILVVALIVFVSVAGSRRAVITTASAPDPAPARS